MDLPAAGNEGVPSANRLEGSRFAAGRSAEQIAITERLLELGLERDPFSDAGIEGLFYPGKQRQEYLELLPHLSHYSHYFVVVVGVKGSGKTILKDRFLKQFDPSLTKIAIINSELMMGPEQLLSDLIDGYRIPEKSAEVSLQSKVSDFIQVNAENGIDCLVVADNAELLSEDALALLFELLNAGENQSLHVILFASPEVNDIFKSPLIRKSYDEWGYSLSLDPFSEVETSEYINYRLTTAGLTDIQFSSQQIESIYQQSRGVPDLINRYSRQVLLQVISKGPSKKRFSMPVVHLVAAGCVGLLLLLLVVVERAPDTIDFEGDDSLIVSVSENKAANTAFKIPTTVKYSGQGFKAKIPSLDVASKEEKQQPLQAKSVSVSVAGSTKEIETRVVQTDKTSAKPNPPNQSSTGFEFVEIEKPKVDGRTPTLTVNPAADKQDIHKSIADKPVDASMPFKTITNKQVATDYAAFKQSLGQVEAKKRSVALRKKEAWLLSLNPSAFTLQLLGARDEQSVKVFTEKYKDVSGLAYYQTSHKGEGWYVVVQGEYSSRQKAQDAVALLPLTLKNRKPWARRVGDVQESIRRNRI